MLANDVWLNFIESLKLRYEHRCYPIVPDLESLGVAGRERRASASPWDCGHG